MLYCVLHTLEMNVCSSDTKYTQIVSCYLLELGLGDGGVRRRVRRVRRVRRGVVRRALARRRVALQQVLRHNKLIHQFSYTPYFSTYPFLFG